VLRVYGQPPIT